MYYLIINAFSNDLFVYVFLLLVMLNYLCRLEVFCNCEDLGRKATT